MAMVYRSSTDREIKMASSLNMRVSGKGISNMAMGVQLYTKMGLYILEHSRKICLKGRASSSGLWVMFMRGNGRNH